MEFEATEIVRHPRDRVYMVHRDRLTAMVPFLPNVDGIDVLQREEVPQGVRVVNRWHVSGSIPIVARPFFSKEALSYLDHALWVDDGHRVEWRFEMGVFPDAVECHGTNFFREGREAGTTEVAVTGLLRIDLSQIRAVPRMLHGVAPRVEAYLFKRVRPNLVAVARAAGTLLDREAG